MVSIQNSIGRTDGRTDGGMSGDGRMDRLDYFKTFLNGTKQQSRNKTYVYIRYTVYILYIYIQHKQNLISYMIAHDCPPFRQSLCYSMSCPLPRVQVIAFKMPSSQRHLPYSEHYRFVVAH